MVMKIRHLSILFASLFLCVTGCNSSNSSGINDDQSDKTVSINNFTKTDDGFLGKINNNIETFSFINRVNVPKNATWSLYTDVAGTVEIPTKTIECKIGDNIVYLLVNGEKEAIGFYKVDVYRYSLYTVSFNTNGGNYIEPQQVQEESLITPVKDPEKRGYTFTSWDYDFKQPVTSNLLINALWNANTYHVTFDPNGGSVSQTSMDVTYGSRCTFPVPAYVGHTFLGWYHGTNRYNDGIWSYTDNLDLVAAWEVSTYQIYYHLNGGNLDGSTQQAVSYGSNFILRTPYRDGYEFLGWYDAANNEINSGVWTRESNLDVHAKWKAKTYTINLNVNGGNPLSTDSVSIQFDSNYSLPIPSREGYAFAGWFDSNKTKYQNDGVWLYPYDITLYASWDVVSYKIKPSIPSTICGLVGYDGEIAPSFTESNYSITYHMDKNTSETINYKVNDAFNMKKTYIPDSSANHFFVGWYMDKSLTIPYNLATGVKAKDNHLYAKWGENTSFYSSTSQFQNADNETRRITMTSNTAQYCVVVQATGRYKITINPKFEYSGSSKMANIVFRNRGVSSDIIFMWDFAYTTEAKTYTGQFTCGDTLQFTYMYTGLTVRDYELTVEALDEINVNKNSEPLEMSISYNQCFNLGLPLNKDGKEFVGWYSEKSGSGIKLTDSSGNGLTKWTHTNIETVYPYFVGSTDDEITINKSVSPHIKVYDQDGKIFNVKTNFENEIKIPFENAYTSGSYAYAFKGYTRYSSSDYLSYGTSNTLSNGANLYPQYEKIDVSSSWKRSVINFDNQTSVSRKGIWNYYYYCPFDGEVTIKWDFTEQTGDIYYQVGVYYSTNSGSFYYDRVGEKKLTVTSGNFYYVSLNAYSKPSASSAQTDVNFNCKLTVESPNGNYYKLDIPFENETQKLFVGENFDLDIPVAPAGYSFAGWYSEPAGKGIKLTDNLGVGIGIWNYGFDTVYSYFKKI